MQKKVVLFSLIFVSSYLHSFKCLQLIDKELLRSNEKEILVYINRERNQLGLNPLSYRMELEKLAKKHTQKMASEDQLSHTFPGYKKIESRMLDSGLYFLSAGENIAFSDTYIAKYIHAAFMRSKPHRENILNKNFSHCGIKIIETKKGFYITQEFAQLFTPLEVKEVTILLEEYLISLCEKKYKQRIILFPQVKAYAKNTAREYLLGNKVKVVNEKWGSFFLLNYLFPNLKKLKASLKEYVSRNRVYGAAIGVDFGRNKKYPGGTYSISIFLFSRKSYNYYDHLSLEKIKLKLFKHINQLRIHHGCRALILNKKLSRKALMISRKYYKNPEIPYSSRSLDTILAFQTFDPANIPSEFNHLLIASKRKGLIGINIFDPIKFKNPGDFFIISIIIKNY